MADSETYGLLLDAGKYRDLTTLPAPPKSTMADAPVDLDAAGAAAAADLEEKDDDDWRVVTGGAVVDL